MCWSVGGVFDCLHGLRVTFTQLFFLLSFSCRKSFFSGHASFAMYTMLYLAVSHFSSQTNTHAHTKHQLETCVILCYVISVLCKTVCGTSK